MSTINHRVNEALLRAKNLIRDPRHWTKGVSQEDRYDSDEGRSFTAYCATGAINEIGAKYGFTEDEISAVKMSLAKALDDKFSNSYGAEAGNHIVSVNDRNTTTHDDIIAAFDKAMRQRREATR